MPPLYRLFHPTSWPFCQILINCKAKGKVFILRAQGKPYRFEKGKIRSMQNFKNKTFRSAERFIILTRVAKAIGSVKIERIEPSFHRLLRTHEQSFRHSRILPLSRPLFLNASFVRKLQGGLHGQTAPAEIDRRAAEGRQLPALSPGPRADALPLLRSQGDHISGDVVKEEQVSRFYSHYLV